MFFVSKKKYNEMKKSRDRWKTLADRWMSHTEDANKLAEEWEKMAVSCQEDNKRLIAHEEEMLAALKKMENQRDMWRERAEEENRQAEIYRGMLKSAEVG